MHVISEHIPTNNSKIKTMSEESWDQEHPGTPKCWRQKREVWWIWGMDRRYQVMLSRSLESRVPLCVAPRATMKMNPRFSWETSRSYHSSAYPKSDMLRWEMTTFSLLWSKESVLTGGRQVHGSHGKVYLGQWDRLKLREVVLCRQWKSSDRRLRRWQLVVPESLLGRVARVPILW